MQPPEQAPVVVDDVDELELELELLVEVVEVVEVVLVVVEVVGMPCKYSPSVDEPPTRRQSRSISTACCARSRLTSFRRAASSVGKVGVCMQRLRS